jgi:hypothetical protein
VGKFITGWVMAKIGLHGTNGSWAVLGSFGHKKQNPP